MNFKPLHDRVLVRRVESDQKTAGGIIIPDTAQEKPMEGEVLEVGSGARDELGKLVPLDVKKGDKILFGKWSGTEVKMNEKKEFKQKILKELKNSKNLKIGTKFKKMRGSQMPSGKVKWFNSKKGYGFITDDETKKDIFLHVSALEESRLRVLKEDQTIFYDIKEEKDKLQAINIKKK